MSYQTRSFDLINAITGESRDPTNERLLRIIDSFYERRKDLSGMIEFVADRTNPTDEEKARVFIEAFRIFGEITVGSQARLEKEEEMESDFVTSENDARADFLEII